MKTTLHFLLVFTLLSSALLQAGITYSVGVESLVGRTSSSGSLDPLTVRVGRFANGFTPTASNYDQWSGQFSLLMPAGDLIADSTAFITAVSPDSGPWRMANNSITINAGADPAGFTAGTQIYVWISNAASSGTSTEAALLTDSTWTYTPAASSPQTPVTFRFQDEAPTVIAGTFNDRFTDANNETGIRLVTHNIPVPPLPGTLAFSNASASFSENAGVVNLTINRTGGNAGTVGVTVTSSNGRARAGSDFIAVNQVLSFAAGETSKSVSLEILADTLQESDETLTLQLRANSGGALLGNPASMTVTIRDADATAPTVTILSPATNATVQEGAVSIQGTAADNRGLAAVEIRLNTGSWAEAAFSPTQGGLSGAYIASLIPLGGVNTVQVRSRDSAGNFSAIVSRSFTYVINRTLTVTLIGPAGSGSLPSPFPGVAIRRVGTAQTITATPRSGFVFAGWTANSWEDTRTTPASRALPTLTFTMKEGLVLTANFAPTPYTSEFTGTYAGLIRWSSTQPAPSGTSPSHETSGCLRINVTSRGTVSGSAKADGASFAFSGEIDAAGSIRFGVAKSSLLTLVRTTRPSLELALTINLQSPSVRAIQGVLTRRGRGGVELARSDVTAFRTAFSSVNKAPESLAGAVSRKYTAVLAYQTPQASGLSPTDYPLGNGYATGSMSASGQVSYSGVLADGTSFLAAAPVIRDHAGQLFWPLYQELYNKTGSILSWVLIQETEVNHDMASTLHWFKPFQLVQWYPFGWPEGVEISFVASKYDVPTTASGQGVFPGPISGGPLKPMDAALGNANLTISGGLLPADITRNVNISESNTVSPIPLTDTSFLLRMTSATGLVTGSFEHADGTRPPIQGVILQRGPFRGAYGFFRSSSPKLTDFYGQIGAFSMLAK